MYARSAMFPARARATQIGTPTAPAALLYYNPLLSLPPRCYARLVSAVPEGCNFEVPHNFLDRVKGRCGPSPWLVGFTRFARAAFGLVPSPGSTPVGQLV